ncbi:hydrogenase expression/formation protein HypD [Eubacterium uniforme]|uniref:Hydrogenase expression/formation protein HypD n=1 Tax=Eubacterium uniforme TaxID=39495 RepID=A0A1T4VC23_9FIRM|nr:hydrogenase formation protein HypD [Eubacterium uniforme]SKA62453.1 hydrogenase expression/formation protein HypD [Eubacterium uniforme]HAH18601.1 hydrogenase formation protein HypD [Eubacterium sp.]
MLNEAIEYLKSYDGPQINIMEVCGTHTHEIFRKGIRKILSPKIKLISGPGCPVCVTPVSFIDEARYLAEQGVTICTFGDLVRVPGSDGSLADSRAAGGKIKVCYSPMDAMEYAKEHTDEEVVFLSVGFETTTPSDVLSVKTAMDEGVSNFSLLTANKTMPNAYLVLKDSMDCYLYPGHVHAIIGTGICEELAANGVSGVVAGFTDKELVLAIAVAVKNAAKRKGYVDGVYSEDLAKENENKGFFVNCYPRVVKAEGSPKAVKLVDEFMEPSDEIWRGIGLLEKSGMKLKEKYKAYDARVKYNIPAFTAQGNKGCRCGDVLQGKILPSDCPLFGKACNPDHPVGACMVSDEGACSAFYMYN